MSKMAVYTVRHFLFKSSSQLKDEYQTIRSQAVGEFKDRGSKFIAYAFPVTNEDEISECLDEVRKEHNKARHHCYAYRLGLDQNNFRANDDGEPSGTAGRPILGQIDSFELTNVLVVVVRYFGGTKLGTSGLINAYKTSAEAALAQADVYTKVLENVYRLEFDYTNMGNVMSAIERLNLNMIAQDFDEHPSLQIALRQREANSYLIQLRSLVADITVEEAQTLKKVEGLEIFLVGPR